MDRREPFRRREITPPEVRAERQQQAELEALDRDTRTVFAYNLPLRAEEKEIFQFFMKAGEQRSPVEQLAAMVPS
jgi:RNA-binding protein 39